MGKKKFEYTPIVGDETKQSEDKYPTTDEDVMPENTPYDRDTAPEDNSDAKKTQSNEKTNEETGDKTKKHKIAFFSDLSGDQLEEIQKDPNKLLLYLAAKGPGAKAQGYGVDVSRLAQLSGELKTLVNNYVEIFNKLRPDVFQNFAQLPKSGKPQAYYPGEEIQQLSNIPYPSLPETDMTNEMLYTAFMNTLGTIFESLSGTNAVPTGVSAAEITKQNVADMINKIKEDEELRAELAKSFLNTYSKVNGNISKLLEEYMKNKTELDKAYLSYLGNLTRDAVDMYKTQMQRKYDVLDTIQKTYGTAEKAEEGVLKGKIATAKNLTQASIATAKLQVEEKRIRLQAALAYAKSHSSKDDNLNYITHAKMKAIPKVIEDLKINPAYWEGAVAHYSDFYHAMKAGDPLAAAAANYADWIYKQGKGFFNDNETVWNVGLGLTLLGIIIDPENSYILKDESMLDTIRYSQKFGRLTVPEAAVEVVQKLRPDSGLTNKELLKIIKSKNGYGFLNAYVNKALDPKHIRHIYELLNEGKEKEAVAYALAVNKATKKYIDKANEHFASLAAGALSDVFLQEMGDLKEIFSNK